MDSIDYQVTPNDSRYVPFTQQHYCCVPTSIQMLMYRNGIPLISAEELGYHLGLTVPPEDSKLFYLPRVMDNPPSEAGYGTQIYNPLYEPNKVFQKLGIPFKFSQKLATELHDVENMLNELYRVEANNRDALLCFNHGVIRGKYEPNTGHVVVFDRVIGGKIRIIDASWKHPKWRLIEPGLLFDAVVRHGNEKAGGIWFFERISEVMRASGS